MTPGIMQPYRGANTSLYHSLDQNAIEHLERVGTLTEQGAYQEAQEILDKHLSAQSLNPAVVLARAELALKQLKYGVLYRMLNEALVKAVEGEERNLDAPEYRLMGLLRALAILSHKGNYKPAVEEIGRAQSWLKEVHVNEYTDVQVQAV